MYVHIHTCTYIHIETPGTTYPPSKLVPGDNWAQRCAAPVPCLGERLDMISPAIGRGKYMYTCTYRHIPSEAKPIQSTPEKTRCVWETILFYHEGTNWETSSSINWHIYNDYFSRSNYARTEHPVNYFTLLGSTQYIWTCYSPIVRETPDPSDITISFALSSSGNWWLLLLFAG